MHVALFLLLCLNLQPHVAPSSTNENSKHPEAPTQSKITQTLPTRLSIGSSVSEQSGKSEEEKREEARDKWLYHLYEWATIAGVVGGWIVLFIVGKQSKAIVNAERAWIMAELDWTPMFHSISATRDTTGDPTSTITVRLRYRNDGNTPGWVDEIKARFEIVQRPNKRPDVKSMERIKSGVLPYGPVPLGIGSKEYVDFSLKCIGQEEIGKQNIVYGVIYYRDAFKKKRRTFFGFRLLGEDNIIYFPEFPEYNKHT